MVWVWPNLSATRTCRRANLLESAIERAERHNPKLNAIVYKAYDQARASAAKLPDGPFKGVPFLIKDLGLEVAGMPRTDGTAFNKNEKDTYRRPADPTLQGVGRQHLRQDEHAGIRHHRHDGERAPRALPQSVEHRPHHRRLVRRIGERGRSRHRAACQRFGRVGFDPHSGGVLRPRRHEGDAIPRAARP